MKYFVKYNNWWWEYDASLPKSSTTLYNSGFGMSSDIDIRGLETAEAEDRTGLDWYGTDVLNDKFKTGWLSPSGKFFGCDYRHHLDQARYVHKKREEELENLGWIKISYRIYYNKDKTRSLEAIFSAKDNDVNITDEQLNYIKNNYKDKDGQEMLMYLHRCKMIKRDKIKWENELEK